MTATPLGVVMGSDAARRPIGHAMKAVMTTNHQRICIYPAVPASVPGAVSGNKSRSSPSQGS